MREIKFRAWYPYIPVMYSWEELKKSWWKSDLFDGPFKMMQYTGLKDKTGKEIYEGDIVKKEVVSNPSPIFKTRYVTYSRGMFLLGDSPLGWPAYICLEIIGNRYENPELLES